MSRNRVYLALTHLIKASQNEEVHERRLLMRSRYFMDWNISSLKEFNTIKVCGSRQSGHTTAIIDTLIKNKNFKTSLVLVDNFGLKGHFKSSFINKIYKIDNKKINYINDSISFDDKIVFVEMFGKENFYVRFSDIKFDVVFIDVASFISENKKDKLYNLIKSKSIQLSSIDSLIIFME